MVEPPAAMAFFKQAAALGHALGPGKVVCVVSGGNIDAAKLAAILGGELPT